MLVKVTYLRIVESETETMGPLFERSFSLQLEACFKSAKDRDAFLRKLRELIDSTAEIQVK